MRPLDLAFDDTAAPDAPVALECPPGQVSSRPAPSTQERRTIPMPVFIRERQDAILDPLEVESTGPATRRDWLASVPDDAPRTPLAPVLPMPIVDVGDNPFTTTYTGDDWSELGAALSPERRDSEPAPPSDHEIVYSTPMPAVPPAVPAPPAPPVRSTPFVPPMPLFVLDHPVERRFRDAHRALLLAVLGLLFFGIVLSPIACAMGHRARLASFGDATRDAETAATAVRIAKLGFVVHLVLLIAAVPCLAFVLSGG